MSPVQERKEELFDQWPDKYDNWFTTPIGRLVKQYETDLLLKMLEPQSGELILDVGCGSGIFTSDILTSGSRVVGIDISVPMLQRAREKIVGLPFNTVAGDMVSLPFHDNIFDRVYSMTALEFIQDARQAVQELERVARRGATIVLTTLNSLSPWAERRNEKAKAGHSLFQSMTFRSPADLLEVTPAGSHVQTAIHFLKSDPPAEVAEIEEQGMKAKKNTGAFVAVSWQKK